VRFLLLAGLSLFTAETWLTSLAVAQDVPPGAPSGYLRQLRFSPDGRYVLAQDDSAVIVISVKPLAVLFRIPAVKATAVRFTSDSQDVVFISEGPNTRVERWHIADRSQVSVVSTGLPACGTAALSPDGRYLACDDYEWTFWLFDGASKKTILKRYLGTKLNEGCSPGAMDLTAAGGYDRSCWSRRGIAGAARIGFSADGHFLIAAPAVSNDVSIAWDLHEGKAFKWKRDLWLIPRWDLSFTFVGPESLVVSPLNSWHGRFTASVVAVPSGKRLGKLQIPRSLLLAATDPGYVIIRPCGQYAAGAVEISTGQITPSVSPDMDVFGQHYVTELPNGDVGLYERGKGLQASVSVKPL